MGDSCDNCVFVKNPGQEDLNQNGFGDACEGDGNDFDGDGIVDALDNCIHFPDSSQINTGETSPSSCTGGEATS